MDRVRPFIGPLEHHADSMNRHDALKVCFSHDVSRKPVPTFRHHALTLLILLASCAAAREGRIRTALADAGLPPAMAACMATPLAQDLSTTQLQALARLGRTMRDRSDQLSERQLLDLLRRDLDPQTAVVVARAGVGCLLRG